MDNKITILLVEDNLGDARLLQESLKEVSEDQFDLIRVESLEAAKDAIRRQHFNAVLLDLSLPDSHGHQTVERMHDFAPSLPLIVLTGLDDEAAAVEAVRLGAQDYLIKGQTDGRLLMRALQYAIYRKQAAEALRESEQRLRLAMKAGQTGTWEMDLQTNQLQRSETTDLLFGFESRVPQRHSQDYIDRVHPDDREYLIRTLKDNIESGQEFYTEFRLRLPDDSIRWIASRGEFQREEHASSVRLAGTVIDITRRKQTEEQLRALNETLEQRVAERTAEAEQRAAQLRVLAAELIDTEQRERRNLAQILHDHLQQFLIAARMKLGIVRSQASQEKLDSVLADIDQLLKDSITASRSLTVELSPPILYEAGLEAALAWLARQNSEKYGQKVTLRIDVPEEIIDEQSRVLLFQAARELLLNVVKHAGVDRAEVRVMKRQDDSLCMTVSDQGKGFDPATARSDSDSPTGFGLFSMQERLELLGGRFEIESEIGNGTDVSLMIPLQPQSTTSRSRGERKLLPNSRQGPADRRKAQPKKQSALTSVMIVDDHEILREGLVGLLSGAPDIKVVGEASDGVMAVERALQLRPDVIIMDITMPRMNGIEATRRITSALPDVKIIGLSVHEEADMAAAIQQAGAVTYLNKGTHSDDLLAIIRKIRNQPVHADRRSYLDSTASPGD